MNKLRVLDLFSGIGGFSLGLERAGGFETVAFCEIEPYCRRVLAKHWPGVPCYEDVRELSAQRLWDDGNTISIQVICGGFPCQDISDAGECAGIDGERSGLWREFARIIGDLRPRYVIVENVAALLHRGMGTVLGDLAALGYDAEWHCIPAGHVGASHERDRVWIIAHIDQARCAHAQGRQGQAEPHGRQILTADHVGRWPRDRTPEPALVRVVDGVSADVDAVAALGNAVVPQIPELIGKAIMQAEGMRQ